MANIKAFWSKYGSTVLTVCSVLGTISAPLLAVSGKERADEALWDAEEEKGEELTTNEKIKIAGKYYIPTIVATGIGAGCAIGAHAKDNKTILGLTAAYNTAVGTVEILDRHVKETAEPEKYSQIQKEIGDLSEKDNQSVNYIPSQHGYDDRLTWFREPLTGQWKRMNMDMIIHAKNNIRDRLGDGEDVYLNDYLEEFGFEPVEIGYDFVWYGNLDGAHERFDIKIESLNSEIDGTPYGLFVLNKRPKARK